MQAINSVKTILLMYVLALWNLAIVAALIGGGDGLTGSPISIVALGSSI